MCERRIISPGQGYPSNAGSADLDSNVISIIYVRQYDRSSLAKTEGAYFLLRQKTVQV